MQIPATKLPPLLMAYMASPAEKEGLIILCEPSKASKVGKVALFYGSVLSTSSLLWALGNAHI